MGPAALATAASLRRNNDLAVLVAGTATCDQNRVGESVPPTFALQLRRLGIEAGFAIQAHVATPGTISVWGDASPGYNDYLFHPPGHGWRLDRAAFEHLLMTTARERGAIAMQGFTLRDLRSRDDGFDVLLVDGDRDLRVRAAHLVDATGVAARVARSLGVKRRIDDRLIALVHRSRAESTTSWHTMLEANELGWWYQARIPGDRLLSMFVTDRETLVDRGQTRVWFEARARTSLVDVPDTTDVVTQHVSSSVLDRVVGSRWIAVGDAGLACDPLFGAGLESALKTAIDGADLLDARLRGDDVRERQLASQLSARAEGYADARRALYRREARWATSGFWMRRGHTAAVISSR